MAAILIADDEEPLRGFVARGLQLDGHTVHAAADGAEALDMLLAARRVATTCCSPTSACR